MNENGFIKEAQERSRRDPRRWQQSATLKRALLRPQTSEPGETYFCCLQAMQSKRCCSSLSR